MPIRSMTYPVCPALQADATLAQANPVSGTKYTVLATAQNVRLLSINEKDTWTVQPNPLEAWVTIDGVTYRFYVANPVSGTNYFAAIDATAADGTLDSGDNYTVKSRSFLLEGRSVKVEAEVTGGTSDPLVMRVKYGKW